MNYKKLLNTLAHSKFSNMSCNRFTQKSDSTMPVVALVAGLAIGAALSILFAPKKGEDTRAMIADGAHDLSDTVMRKFKEAKKRLIRTEEEMADTADRHVTNIRKKAKKAAEKLTGPEDTTKNPSEIKVPGTASKAWKENMDA